MKFMIKPAWESTLEFLAGMSDEATVGTLVGQITIGYYNTARKLRKAYNPFREELHLAARSISEVGLEGSKHRAIRKVVRSTAWSFAQEAFRSLFSSGYSPKYMLAYEMYPKVLQINEANLLMPLLKEKGAQGLVAAVKLGEIGDSKAIPRLQEFLSTLEYGKREYDDVYESIRKIHQLNQPRYF